MKSLADAPEKEGEEEEKASSWPLVSRLHLFGGDIRVRRALITPCSRNDSIVAIIEGKKENIWTTINYLSEAAFECLFFGLVTSCLPEGKRNSPLTRDKFQ